ncbi:MAG TPA: UDP-3-O-(3-hydroxymyristoyl)glucosamine N-acyltransferase, partial [Opitutae bacterium]|nr:UDP-3-O-(3-hydroxymyristoyl)glucosamine N-acyltransferase [Opitutae bacterium]
MAFAYTPQRILQIVGETADCVGAYDDAIVGISSLSEAIAGDLSFLGNPKYRPEVEASKASVLLLPKDYEGSPKQGQLFIKLENPSFALALICRDIENTLNPKPEPGIHASAVVHPDAVVSPLASVGPLCVIGQGAKIGAAVLEAHVSVGRYARIADDAYLFPRVVVADYCEIGLRNRLQAGCVIGSDGYGYEFHEGAHQRVPQIGKVVLEEDVDIGANSTLDRARFGSTIIGTGTKVDNQVQIAHNVRVGKGCLIVAQVGISGSTELGDGVVVAGQAGIAGHLKIGSGAMIAGGTAVTSSIDPKAKVRGYPVMPMMQFNRIAILQRKLPELFKRFDQVEKTVEALTTNG